MSRFLSFLIALSLTVVMLCGCGGSSDNAPTGNGTLGPTGFRGVIQEKRADGELVPLSNVTVTAHRASADLDWGPEFTRTATDAQGRFFIAVPPGWNMVGSLYPSQYAEGCKRPNPIRIENLAEGEVKDVVITQEECR